MCARCFGNGGSRRVFPRTLWRLSVKVATWSVSQSNAPPGIHRAYPRMPDLSSSKPFLAFDLGAESGRAILARLHSGILTTQEIHRFKNEPVEYGARSECGFALALRGV